MKGLKIAGLTLISIILIIYISFLFILPNVININAFMPEINKAIKELSGLQLDIKNAKLKTSWNMQAKILLNDVTIKYPNNKTFLSAKTSEAGLKLLPLFTLKIELAPIKIENPKLLINIEKDGRYDIEKFASELIKNTQTPQQETSQPQTFPIKISENMPDIILENYNIELKDTLHNENLIVKGPEFKITDFKLNNKIKILTSGDISVNNKKHATYNAQIESFLPQVTNTQTPQTPIEIPQITYNPIPVIKKYNFGANIDTNLKISEKNNEIFIKGYLNADKLNYKIQGNNIDKSFIKLGFNGTTIDIDSNLYVDKTEKFTINGLFKSGKKQYIDLKILSKKIDLVDIQRIIIALLDIANIKNDIAQLNITGWLDSDFNIKSDMKKIQSSGYLKVENANIKHSKLPLAINSIKSDIDFNNNKLTIKNTSALINNALFNLTGQIDTNANADIKISTDKLPINLLYEAFAPIETKKTISINNGLLSLNAIIKGKLDKIEPKIDLTLDNLNVKEKTIGANVKIANTLVNLTANTKGEFKGSAKATNASISITEPKTIIQMPIGELLFDTQNITIKPSDIKLDNSNFSIDGVVKDYINKLNAQINVNGKFASTDTLKYLPKEARTLIKTQGYLPIKAKITSDGKNTNILGQLYADKINYISVLDISSIKNKPSIINVDINTDGNSLKLIDCSFYGLNTPISLTNNFKQNLNSSFKIAGIDGKIGQLTSKAPTLQNIKIVTPNPITASIPGFANSALNLKADMTISGTTLAPIIKGAVSIPNITIPDFKLSGKNINIDFAKDTITAKSPSIDINGSQIAFSTVIDSNFGKYTTIKDLTITSPYIDVDKLLAVLESMPQNNVAPSASIPVIIEKGYGKLTKVKSGNLVATDASANFNLKSNIFKLTNLKATAYNGIIAGNIDYNIPYETIKANIQGRNLDSNPAVTAITGLKDQLQGKLDFDANISMMGMVYEQQMKTLKGNVSFAIGEGQMGSLGRLEHFIYASNMISQKFASSTLNSIIQTLAPKNTGKFNYLKGALTFNNGWAKINPIHSGGPQMSLYITGDFNILNNYAKIEILGRVANEIVSVMGPIGNMSVSKLLSNFSSFGSSASSILNSYNAIKDANTIAKVPQLIPESKDTKQFQVIIDGNVQKPTAVRSFKWIASEAEVNAAKAQLNTTMQNLIPTQLKNVLQSATNKKEQTTTQSIGDTLKDAAKNAATEQLKTILPNFWDSIE